jgi:hypothetical protein
MSKIVLTKRANFSEKHLQLIFRLVKLNLNINLIIISTLDTFKTFRVTWF